MVLWKTRETLKGLYSQCHNRRFFRFSLNAWKNLKFSSRPSESKSYENWSFESFIEYWWRISFQWRIYFPFNGCLYISRDDMLIDDCEKWILRFDRLFIWPTLTLNAFWASIDFLSQVFYVYYRCIVNVKWMMLYSHSFTSFSSFPHVYIV